ncbi:hypothetical protein HGP14_34545 [Rhizobium sp. P32RR-XVIII]|uniref:hypothetical protein n=1 Tax=Rhizobium sp. P32RR-XVIII TaxID=2726738 RepID=UPI0014568A66|nr:hypothetical protein [Rhizobium sp. P32RR-XVIII]NLS08306.1 hypothetical protein [Rhizobium sp. P32RR-XVIII]
MTSAEFPFVFPQFHKAMDGVLAEAKIKAEFANAALRFQIEGLSFLQDRLEKDLKFFGTLAAAPASSDSLDVLNDFTDELIIDYARETSRFFTVLALVAQNAAVLAHGEAERSIIDIAATSVAP